MRLAIAFENIFANLQDNLAPAIRKPQLAKRKLHQQQHHLLLANKHKKRKRKELDLKLQHVSHLFSEPIKLDPARHKVAQPLNKHRLEIPLLNLERLKVSSRPLRSQEPRRHELDRVTLPVAQMAQIPELTLLIVPVQHSPGIEILHIISSLPHPRFHRRQALTGAAPT